MSPDLPPVLEDRPDAVTASPIPPVSRWGMVVRVLLPMLVVDLLLFSALGMVVISWLPRPWRGPVLAGAPALGAATLVVALHLTSLLVGVRVGTVVVLVIAGVGLTVRSWRCRWWRDVGRSSWGLLAAALVAGALSLTSVITPFRAAAPTVVETANDAFYYVSVTDWLLDHSALTLPTLGVDPPAYGATRVTLQIGLRLGEEMDEGAVTTVTGRDPIDTWSTTTLMWLFLIPGACIAAFEILGLRPIAGVVGGVLTAGSAVVAVQVLGQNSSGLLGILVAPMAIALWGAYFARTSLGELNSEPAIAAPRRSGEGAVRDSLARTERPPLWLLALALDGLVGAYTEYLPIVGAGMLLYVALRRPRLWRRASVDILKVGAVAVAVAPLIWYNAVRSLLVTTALGGQSLGSPFLGVPLRTSIARLTGATSFDARTGLTLGIALAAWLLAGIILGLLWSPARALFAAILLNFVIVTLLLGSGLHYYAYGEYRAVGTGMSLLVLASVGGWAAGFENLARWGIRRRWIAPALTAVALGGVVFLLANQRTIAGDASHDWSARSPTRDLAESAGWAASVDPHGGSDVSVLIPNFYTQLWSMYALRQSPKANFPFLYPDYALVPPLSYEDGRLRRYVLVSGDVFSQIDPAAVVGGNARFHYLDTSRGPIVVAFGVQNTHDIEVTPGGAQEWMADDGRILVAHTPGVRAVSITLKANPWLGSVPVTIRADGVSGRDYVVGQTDLTVTVPVGPSTVSLLEIDNHVRAVPLYSTDLRPLSVLVEAIRAG